MDGDDGTPDRFTAAFVSSISSHTHHTPEMTSTTAKITVLPLPNYCSIFKLCVSILSCIGLFCQPRLNLRP